MRPVRELLVFHGLYGLAAVLLLGFAPAGYYGLSVAGLVVGYHVALVGTALAGGRSEWLRLWAFLLPLSLLQVVPDWILAELIGSLRFYDHGVPRIGAVPVYMAGMWMIPLFLCVRLADALGTGPMRPLLAAGLALLLFGGSEWYAAPLGLWQAVGVQQEWLGIAFYVLPAEVLLGLAAWWGYQRTGGNPLESILVAAGISVLYTGALITSWFFVEMGMRP